MVIPKLSLSPLNFPDSFKAVRKATNCGQYFSAGGQEQRQRRTVLASFSDSVLLSPAPKSGLINAERVSSFLYGFARCEDSPNMLFLNSCQAY
jgi:hypothetical protein